MSKDISSIQSSNVIKYDLNKDKIMKLKLTDKTQMAIVETHGKHIYNTIPALRDVATIMEHPELRSFIDKYFNDPFDAQNMLIFMKTYKMIEELNPMLTSYQKIAVLSKAMNDFDMRRLIHDDYFIWCNKSTSNINKYQWQKRILYQPNK
jgi:hypothetical protein